MTTEAEVMCPVCGGKTWDNRETKRNPKAPDYKCRDKNCEGVVWPPKPGAAPRAAAPTAKQGYSVGAVPGLDDGSEALPHEKLDQMFRVYDVCFAHAHALAERTMKQDASHEGISAMASTLFIQASHAGLVR